MSKIEWTEQTWNPIVGCSIVSPGCTNCYAMRTAARMNANPATPHYHGTVEASKAGPVWTGKVAMAPERVLLEPLRRRKPTLWFVNSMGDLFHESVPDAWIDKVFAVMALTPQHTFQVLTKRAERMRKYCAGQWDRREALGDLMGEIGGDEREGWYAPEAHSGKAFAGMHVPLPNVWLGVSTERQKEADERIPLLMQTPAAVRFISAEPLLEPIDVAYLEWARLDWVICGGESGPNARPMHPDWPRRMRDQCEAAGIPFFFKQWGGFTFETRPGTEVVLPDLAPGQRAMWGDGKTNHIIATPCSKKAAGRTLDGKIHDAMPGPMQREAM